MKWHVLLALMVAMLSNNAVAEWVRVGENNRSIAYIDTAISRSGDMASYWVLFDYKAVQESPQSGKRYRSEKAQHETECQSERDRAIFFTWHSEQMGNGVVVYTGKKPTNWEPTSSPGSFGNAFWKFVCGKKSQQSTRSTGASLNLNEIANQIAQQHNANASRMTDNFTVSSSATSSGKNVIFNYTWAIRPGTTKNQIDQFVSAWKAEMIPQACQENANSVAFNQGLYYTFVYSDREKNKITEYNVSRETCLRR